MDFQIYGKDLKQYFAIKLKDRHSFGPRRFQGKMGIHRHCLTAWNLSHPRWSQKHQAGSSLPVGFSHYVCCYCFVLYAIGNDTKTFCWKINH